MLTTVGVMNIAGHAQPALLYLVPGVLGSIWGTALFRGEIKEMWEFSEAADDNSADDKDKEKKKKKSTTHIFPFKGLQEPAGQQKAEGSKDSEPPAEEAQKQSKRSKESFAKRFLRERKEKNEIFYFSITAPRLPSPTKTPTITEKPRTSSVGSSNHSASLEDELRQASEGDLRLEGVATSVERSPSPSPRWRSAAEHGEQPAWKRQKRV